MEYQSVITLKNGMRCLLKSPDVEDAAELIRTFVQTHAETEYLLSYADECRLTEEGEKTFIERQKASSDGAEICAFMDGHIVATAGFSPVGTYEKIRHRAELGISVEKAWWGLGIGNALMQACIEAAGKAGCSQLELEVVADNAAAIRLYEKFGFVEYGRNPRGFRLRDGSWQELVLMRRITEENE